MKKSIALLMLALPAIQANAQFDVSQFRTVITSSSIENNLSWSDVYGSSGSNQSTNVQMYYDVSDENANYAGTENFWNKDYSYYIDEYSALGPKGPLGYAGPLSSIGPLMNTSFNWVFDAWMPQGFAAVEGFYVWNGSANFGFASPYGAMGPLGFTGPITEQAHYTDMYHINETGGFDSQESFGDWNDFPMQLDPAGVWGILGPVGPLGALGPLGPLGPNGYGSVVTTDATGAYKQNGAEIRQLEVAYNGDASIVRRYDLVEFYQSDDLVLRQQNPSQFVNDTSFSVEAGASACNVDYSPANHTYYFKSPYDQWLSVVLTHVNAYAELDFTVSIKSDAQNTFNNADSADAWFGVEPVDFSVTTTGGLMNFGGFNYASELNDFAMLRVKAGEVVKLVVQPRYGSGDVFDLCGYLLHVVGSGFEEKVAGGQYESNDLYGPRRNLGVATFNITGDHQLALPW